MLGTSAPHGQTGASQGHQAKGRLEVRTEWKKEGATWRGRGPASSQGQKGGGLQVRLIPAVEARPAHWHFSGQVIRWEF